MNRIKRKILNWCMRHLFNAVTEDSVLKHDGKNLWLGSTRLTDKQQKAVIAEAHDLDDMYLWSYMLDSLKHAANESMYQNSESDDDIYMGKAMLWAVDVLEKKVKHIKNLG